MTDLITEAEALARISGLTRARLTSFIEAEAIVVQVGTGPLLLEPADIARLGLLCELSDAFDMNPDAAALVLSLIDRLHAAEHDFRTLAAAIANEPAETRARLGAALQQARKSAD